eukprot:EG_transcript_29109
MLPKKCTAPRPAGIPMQLAFCIFFAFDTPLGLKLNPCTALSLTLQTQPNCVVAHVCSDPGYVHFPKCHITRRSLSNGMHPNSTTRSSWKRPFFVDFRWNS